MCMSIRRDLGGKFLEPSVLRVALVSWRPSLFQVCLESRASGEWHVNNLQEDEDVEVDSAQVDSSLQRADVGNEEQELAVEMEV